MKTLFKSLTRITFISALSTVLFTPLGYAGDYERPKSYVVLGDCYKIKYYGSQYNKYKDAYAYKYKVYEKQVKGPHCKDISFWAIDLPGCKVIKAYPKPYEITHKEPHTGFAGVKWELGSSFKEGLFKVYVKNAGGVQPVNVAVKAGRSVYITDWYDRIVGPYCKEHYKY